MTKAYRRDDCSRGHLVWQHRGGNGVKHIPKRRLFRHSRLTTQLSDDDLRAMKRAERAADEQLLDDTLQEDAPQNRPLRSKWAWELWAILAIVLSVVALGGVRLMQLLLAGA